MFDNVVKFLYLSKSYASDNMIGLTVASGKKLSYLVLITVAFFILLFYAYIQFLTPSFYDPDSYYHIALSSFIKNFGVHYEFRWTQFSILKDFFADKDLLFHFSAIPFLYISDNIILAGKYTVIFYNIIFIFTYVFILRKYLPSYLSSLFLLFPFFSSAFSYYFIQFRPITLVNILTILGIYSLINKKLIWVFITALVYSLVHVSFLLFIIFAFICEILRKILNNEFYVRNIYLVLIGSLFGSIIHPNFPNNLLYIKLNSLLVPLYYLRNLGIDFGKEVFSQHTKFVLMDNFILFLSLNIVLWLACLGRKMRFATAVWLACFNIYLIIAFFSNRYWYPANALFFVFFASYLNDLREGREWRKLFPFPGVLLSLYLVSIFFIFPSNLRNFRHSISEQSKICLDYEDIALWMKRHVPANETIYNSKWSDAPLFICLNPKNNYIVASDPIYMLYYYPRIFSIYTNLRLGKFEKPYDLLKKVFKVSYGFTSNIYPLYSQIKSDPDHFDVVYENGQGMIFNIKQR